MPECIFYIYLSKGRIKILYYIHIYINNNLNLFIEQIIVCSNHILCISTYIGFIYTIKFLYTFLFVLMQCYNVCVYFSGM